jgi:hypothetical protein
VTHEIHEHWSPTNNDNFTVPFQINEQISYQNSELFSYDNDVFTFIFVLLAQWADDALMFACPTS